MTQPAEEINARFPLATPPYHPKAKEAIDQVDMGDLSPQNFLRVLAHHPRLMGNVVTLGGTLMYRTALDERLREIAIFRVAARTRSNYEWAMHSALFKERCRLGDDQIAALKDLPPSAPCWNARERLVITAVDELHDTSTIGDATWALLRAEWDQAQLLELLMVIGFYHMVAFFLNATGVGPERGALRFAAF
ncbi:MAG: carboxymuconolactone decarboxylase family protein [Burkholderiales bacterium]|nr:carboxymuconolactone decarboxylase family protein [Burkholderiales bacterium]